MQTRINQLNLFAERWVRTPFAFLLAIVLAALLLVVSENTYRETTSTLRGGIDLTDARIQSQRLLQLLTDAQAAQFGFLVTGQADYLAQHAQAKAELPAVQAVVARYLASQGSEGAAVAQRVADFMAREFVLFDHTLTLARSGQLAAANELASRDRGRIEMLALRRELGEQLARAAGLQQHARVSIYNALKVNRVAVGSLTLVALLSLFLFRRQLQLQNRERQARQAALLGERERLEEEVQRRTLRLAELARHLQSVREDERARLARELHDELGSLMTASKLDIARARMKAGEPAEVLVRLARVTEHLNKGIALKRRIIEDLRPSALSNLGLTIALQNLCDDGSTSLGIPVRLSAVELNLSPDAELAVYRFVQEALTNAGKYASATAIDVVLVAGEANAVAEVRDDGVGFDTERARAGRHGLSGMQFRAESLGGSMHVTSTPGAGTSVRIQFPQVPADEVAQI